MPNNGRQSENLRKAIEEAYNLNELRGLAHDLDIDYEQLDEGPLTTKVVSLITYATRRNKLEQLNTLVEKHVASKTPPDPDETPPYQGLNYFDVGDTDRYFGRDALITSLIQRINDEKLNFLMIVGASGSGKSSLVRAGLIPTLQGKRPQQADTELPQGSKEWPLHLITPSAHPLTELASSLTRVSESVTATTTLIDDLKKDGRSLSLYTRRLLDNNKTDQTLLLVVDQFEELFTACQDEEERKAFIENLMWASQPENGCPILILCTLRADFYHRCLHYESFRAMLETSQANIGPMSRDELKDAIERPATVGEWLIDAGLVETILNDINDEPGALPLLSHALLATWENRKGRTLTVGGYQESGGVKGAIRNTADKFYNSQKEPENQERIKQIFIRLATLGEGQADTRKRVQLDWLLSIDNNHPEQIKTLLKDLADQRLITTSENSAEISHEALLREWPRLREWLDDNRDLLRLYHIMADTSRAWHENDKDSGYLLAGGQLAQVVAREDELKAFANSNEQEFVKLSKQAARRSALVGWGAGAAVIVSILAIIVAFTFFNLNSELQTANDAKDEIVTTLEASENDLKESNSLLVDSEATLQVSESELQDSNDQLIASEATLQSSERKLINAQTDLETSNAELVASQDELDALKRAIQARGLGANVKLAKYSDPDLALMLATVGYQISPQIDTRKELYNIVAQWVDRVSFGSHAGPVNSALFNREGDLILSASDDGTAKIWGLDGIELNSLAGHTGPVNSAVFNASEDLILTASDDETAKLWSFEGNQVTSLDSHTGPVNSALFNAPGDLILTASEDSTAKLWNLEGNEVTSLNSHTGPINSAVFNVSGDLILTASEDSTAKLWNLEGNEVASLDSHTGPVNSAVFNASGDLILTASKDGTAKLWDTLGNELSAFQGSSAGANLALFHPSMDIILISGGGITKFWTFDGEELPNFHSSNAGPVTFAVFSNTGNYVFAVSNNNSKNHNYENDAALWDINRRELAVFIGHAGPINSAVFSPHEDFILTASEDGTVKLWNPSATDFTLITPAQQALFNLTGEQILTIHHDKAWLWDLDGNELAFFSGHSSRIHSAMFNPTGTQILTVSYDEAKLWDLHGNELTTINSHNANINSAMFNPNGDIILTASDDSSAKLWDLSGKELTSIEGHELWVNLAIFDPTGDYILTVGADKLVKIWNHNGDLITTLQGHKGRINHAVFNPEGDSILTASADGTAKLWNLNGNELLSIDSHSGPVDSAVYNREGNLILTVSDDGTAKLWDPNGNELATIGDLDHQVKSAVFNPIGDQILTAGSNNISKLWDINGNELATISDGISWRKSVVFSPKGDQVLTIDTSKGIAKLWNLNIDLLTKARRNIWRGFTDDECQLYFEDELDLCPQTVEALFSMGESSQ